MSRTILHTALVAIALGLCAGGASAQALKAYKVGTITQAVTKPSPSLAKARVLSTKMCHSTYNPSPSSPGMHFGATKQCAAPSSAPVGSSCSCAVTIEGQPATAWGTVFEERPFARGPVVN